MDKKGKLTQIKFEPGLQFNRISGELEISPITVCLWTDEGLKELIKNVTGVVQVTDNVNLYKTYYNVVIDARYDIEFVKKEIEATIMCEIGEL